MLFRFGAKIPLFSAVIVAGMLAGCESSDVYFNSLSVRHPTEVSQKEFDKMECDESLDGKFVYVLESDELYECSDAEWVERFASPSDKESSSSKKNVSSSSKGDAGTSSSKKSSSSGTPKSSSSEGSSDSEASASSSSQNGDAGTSSSARNQVVPPPSLAVRLPAKKFSLPPRFLLAETQKSTPASTNTSTMNATAKSIRRLPLANRPG